MKPKGKSALLNKPGFQSTAAIACKVEVSNVCLDSEITISDCNRSVSLDLNTWGNGKKRQAELENNLHKIDTLIEVLTSFRKDYVKAAEKAAKGKGKWYE